MTCGFLVYSVVSSIVKLTQCLIDSNAHTVPNIASGDSFTLDTMICGSSLLREGFISVPSLRLYFILLWAFFFLLSTQEYVLALAKSWWHPLRNPNFLIPFIGKYLEIRSKLGVVVHSCSSSTWKVQARRSGIQGQPWLYNQFKANLDHMSLCLRTNIMHACTHAHTNTYTHTCKLSKQ